MNRYSIPLTLFGILTGANLAGGADLAMTVDNLDWNAAIWEDAPGSGVGTEVPVAGNDYFTAVVGNATLRGSADGTASTFAGESLTLVSGTNLLLKNLENTNSTIAGPLTLDGGRVRHAPNSASSVRSAPRTPRGASSRNTRTGRARARRAAPPAGTPLPRAWTCATGAPRTPSTGRGRRTRAGASRALNVVYIDRTTYYTVRID